MISVGSYNIRNFEEIEENNTDYYMYKLDLYKGNRKIASIENKGELGLAINLISQFRSVRKNEFNYLIEDMKKLLSNFKGNISKDAICNSFTDTVYMSAIGFTEMLVDLRAMHIQYKEGIEKTEPNKFLAVYSTGGSFYKTHEKTFSTMHQYFNTKAVTYKTALKRTLERIESKKEQEGEVTALALIKGDFNWSLSFEDYAKLFEPIE